MRKTVLLYLSAMCVCPVLLISVKAEDTARAKIMEKKLKFSKEILEAVVKEDFPEMSANAEGLLELAKTQWIENDTPEYRSQLKDFWIVLEGLKSSAKEKNGDGATLAYVQMTLSCVKCHKYLRKSAK